MPSAVACENTWPSANSVSQDSSEVPFIKVPKAAGNVVREARDGPREASRIEPKPVPCAGTRTGPTAGKTNLQVLEDRPLS